MSTRRTTQPVAEPARASDSHVRPLERIRRDLAEREALERELLAFDADGDIANLIAMPTEIPPTVRAAITSLIAERFTAREEAGGPHGDFDEWLYEPHRLLAGESPFDRLIASDALGFLVALIDPADLPTDPANTPALRSRAAAPEPSSTTLTLVR